MQYKTLGRRTGLRVSEFALGAGNFGVRWGHGAEPDQAKAMFDRFVEAGGNFIDTADGYQFGQSEELVGQFVASDRDNFVVASKYTLNTDHAGGLSRVGNSRKNMIRSVEGSLKRLNTDRLDLYWAHFPDDVTPIEEVLRAFDDLVRDGKILHAGLSNFPAWRVARGDALAELRGWAPIAAVQFEYSLAERSADRELLPMAEALGLGAALWSPLGGGFLTGKYRQKSEDAGRLEALKTLVHTETDARKTRVLDEVLAVAGELGVPASQVAVAWLRKRAAVSPTSLIPIIGPRTTAQLEDYLAALKVELSAAQVERLDQASAIGLGQPYEQTAGLAPRLFTGPSGELARPALPVA